MQEVVGCIIYPACNGTHSMPQPGNLNALDYGSPLAIHSSLTLALALDENNLTHFKSVALFKEKSGPQIHCSCC